jgi:GNAT superfamily N-acetyltransferase
MTVTIDRPHPDDWPHWRRLYEGYAAFYRVPMDDAIAGRLWSWIHDPAHIMEAFLARDKVGTPIGLAHFRAMPRPLGGNEIGFLDDLFVDPAARGREIGERLIKAMADEGKRRGWTIVRWLTADDNYRARGRYDQLAKRTMWITYQMDL